MKKLALIAAGAFVFSGAGAADAQDYRAGDMTVSKAWARPAEKGRNGAAYFSIKNAGKDSDRLVSASTPLAEKTELHETLDDKGVMKMRAVKDGIEIKPGSSLELKPGGYHVMLLDLKKPLEVGETVPLTVTLAKAGAIAVEAKVEKTVPGAAGAMPMDMHGGKGMGRIRLLFGPLRP